MEQPLEHQEAIPAPSHGQGNPQVLEEAVGGDEIPSAVGDEIPTIEDEIPTVGVEIPTIEDEIPSIGGDEIPSAVGDEIPTVGVEIPTIEDEIPTVGDEIPSIEDEIPTVGVEIPTIEDEIPTVGVEIPSIGGDEIPSAVGDEIPTIEDEIPTVGVKIPTIGDDIPTTGDEIPTTGDKISAVNRETPTPDRQTAGEKNCAPHLPPNEHPQEDAGKQQLVKSRGSLGGPPLGGAQAVPAEPSPRAGTPGRGAEEDFYCVKWISWKGERTPVITQSENGPCPLLAIMNVLFLQWKVKLPPQKEVVTAEELMAHLGDCILSTQPQEPSEGLQLNFQQNINDTMMVLPKLSTGLDVNVRFTGVADFEYTPECIVFDLLNVPLYHGWLVDLQP
ncbi:PREDICTED: protein FAM63A-like, partial [Mesitornis unicolor]|uniref:protein FAM63A-like n=1 Tax=Mesitornis unicolor TaxID=54374 RepID=UPI00052882B0